MAIAKACKHLEHQPDLAVDYVLDSHLDMADGFVHCSTCAQTYLLEMVDLNATIVLFRVSVVVPAQAAATIHNLQRGSCDIHRARNEVFATASNSLRLNRLLLKERGGYRGLVKTTLPVPGGSWRELPCDGALIDSVQGQPRA